VYTIEKGGNMDKNEVIKQQSNLFNPEEIDLAWLQKQHVMIEDILGVHKGVIHNIVISDAHILLNIITFGQTVNRSLYGLNKDWWLVIE
jgi:hypothetical protein